MRRQIGNFTVALGRDVTRNTTDICADCGYPIPSWWPIRYSYSDGVRHYLCALRHVRGWKREGWRRVR